MAYADMYDLMDLTESMISGLVKHLTGGLKIQYHPNGPEGEALELDFTTPWKRFDMIEELEKQTGETFPRGEELGSDETNAFLRRVCEKVRDLGFAQACIASLTFDRIVAQRRLRRATHERSSSRQGQLPRSAGLCHSFGPR